MNPADPYVVRWMLPEERLRELEVRRVRCRVCGAVPHQPCRYPASKTGGATAFSHTARYLRAVVAGLVPPMSGQP